jgi:hypothetical protein
MFMFVIEPPIGGTRCGESLLGFENEEEEGEKPA